MRALSAVLGKASLGSWLWQPRTAIQSYSAAMLLAAMLVLYLYPLSFLLGQGQFFEGGDAAQHVSGWLFFKHEQWRFPLLLSTRLNAPDGISIAFTDSIPLLALVLKPFSSLLPESFHYFGLWHAFSYLFQAYSAVFLLRSLNILHLPGAVIATVFAITWPALTHRFGHTALMSHGLLLLALAFYLRGFSRSWSLNRTSLCFIALSSAALLIHPYLLAMIYPVLLVYLLSQWCASRISLVQGASWVAVSLLVLLGLMVAGGYLIGKGAAINGFGSYSFNLLSPVCGGMLCSMDYADFAQDEGFNYFGAGLLLLLAWVLIKSPVTLLAIIKRHWILLFLLLGFTLFAVSNRIYLGQIALFEVPLDPRIQEALGVFRVSGRFFWLVGYVVLFVVLAIVLRRFNALSFLICTVAVLLQWYDTGWLRDRVRYSAQMQSIFELEPWRMALTGFSQINLYPVYGCADVSTETYVRYQSIAAHLGLTINTAYTARHTQNCDQAQAFTLQPVKAGELYVLANLPENQWVMPPLFQRLVKEGHCARESDQLLCAAGYPAQHWLAVATPLDPTQELTHTWAASQLPSVIGHVIDGRLTSREQGAVGYLSYGPYINMAAGEYDISFDYISSAGVKSQVGRWDVVGQVRTGQTVLMAEGEVYGTQLGGGIIQYRLKLNEPLTHVEARLFSQGENMEVKSLTVTRVNH